MTAVINCLFFAFSVVSGGPSSEESYIGTYACLELL